MQLIIRPLSASMLIPSVINPHKNDLINLSDETSQTINVLVAAYEYKQKIPLYIYSTNTVF